MSHIDPILCPFCGESDQLLIEDETRYYMLCLSCRASGPCTDDKDEAFILWCERKEEEECIETSLLYKRQEEQ